jgi:hypothetical protein
MDLRNVGILPQHYMTSQPRRPRLDTSTPCHPQTHNFVLGFYCKRVIIYLLRNNVRIFLDIIQIIFRCLSWSNMRTDSSIFTRIRCIFVFDTAYFILRLKSRTMDNRYAILLRILSVLCILSRCVTSMTVKLISDPQ